MTFFSPLADIGLALIFILGSVSVGYAGMRVVYSPFQSWPGWKRTAAGALVGVGWAMLFLLALTPNANGVNVPIALLAEFFAYAGLGLILVVGIAAAATRMVHVTIQRANSTQEGISASTLNPPGFTISKPGIYKPSQLRQTPEKKINESPEMEEPVLENDLMDILREGSEPNPRTKKKSPIATEPVTRAPMSELSDFSGFEDTLAQLKKDLKDFNESMNKTHTR